MPIYKTSDKKDGKTKYRVVVSYTTPDGKYKKKERAVYGQAEAKTMEAQLLRELKEAPPATRMTVEQLFDEYIAAKRHEVRETTLDKSERILRAEVIASLGDKPLDKLNKKLLQSWKNALGERDLSLTTRKNIFSEFRAMLNWAVKMDLMPKNYLGDLGNFRDNSLETHTEEIHYYTPEQFKLYIARAAESAQATQSLTDWGYYVFFAVAFYTGARKGEINALRWSDIDGDVIHIRRSIAQKLRGGDRETAPKNRSSIRDIKVPDPLADILAQHKARQAADPKFSESYRVCGGPVCLRDTSISNRNKVFAAAAGLPVIRVHDFRHSHATVLINEGINIQEIARRLGHSNVQITWGTYAHLYPREEDRAIAVLNRIV